MNTIPLGSRHSVHIQGELTVCLASCSADRPLSSVKIKGGVYLASDRMQGMGRTRPSRDTVLVSFDPGLCISFLDISRHLLISSWFTFFVHI